MVQHEVEGMVGAPGRMAPAGCQAPGQGRIVVRVDTLDRVSGVASDACQGRVLRKAAGRRTLGVGRNDRVVVNSRDH